MRDIPVHDDPRGALNVVALVLIGAAMGVLAGSVLIAAIILGG